MRLLRYNHTDSCTVFNIIIAAGTIAMHFVIIYNNEVAIVPAIITEHEEERESRQLGGFAQKERRAASKRLGLGSG